MFTNCDEWCRLECRECKHFNAKADMNGVESTCKRLDHKHLRFAKKIFQSYDCGCHDTHTCSDFEPDEKKVPWLYNHWNEVKEQIIPYGEFETIELNVDGNTDVRYVIWANDFYNNTFINKDGSLKWVYKYYQVPSRSSVTHYDIVYETADGITVRNREIVILWIRGLLNLDFDILQKVLSKGNKHGSAFNEILNYYDIKDKDLTKITNDMALVWLSQKESKEKENDKNV